MSSQRAMQLCSLFHMTLSELKKKKALPRPGEALAEDLGSVPSQAAHKLPRNPFPRDSTLSSDLYTCGTHKVMQVHR